MGFMWVYGVYTQAQTYSDTIQGVWVAGMGIGYAISGGHILAGVGTYMIMGVNFFGVDACCRNGPGHLTRPPLPSGFKPSLTRYHMSARKFYIFRENLNRN